MIQEKDFLYRVPVKTAPITTTGGQIRNPEILVDIEGGEFMRGNILDANSTNKLVNQSVKDAIDKNIADDVFVTKDLLEAETTRATEQENSLKTLIGAETGARAKGDEDLSSKIKAEQTRAEGKEKEISDKLAIVNGDSNTEGSFRKAIADVVAAAPEDLDTLKEIADKLAGNDDLHTALNQAITEKADASALANEVSRATGAESNLQAAIGAKQDAGSYITYNPSDRSVYQINKGLDIKYNDAVTASYSPLNGIVSKNGGSIINITYDSISLKGGDTQTFDIQASGISLKSDDRTFSVDPFGIKQVAPAYTFDVNSNDGIKLALGAADDAQSITLNPEGISNTDNNANHVFATDGSIADLTQYALKTELPTVPTKTSQLTNDSNFITVDNFASIDDVSNLRVDLSRKQDKITVNDVDITDIETADITKLRTIVTNLINALSESDLIRKVETLK